MFYTHQFNSKDRLYKSQRDNEEHRRDGLYPPEVTEIQVVILRDVERCRTLFPRDLLALCSEVRFRNPAKHEMIGAVSI